MQWPDPAKSCVLVAQIHGGGKKLCGNEQANCHANDTPYDGGNGKVPDNFVVVVEFFSHTCKVDVFLMRVKLQ